MINRYCWRSDASLGTVSLYGVSTMEIIFGGKPAEATYHKEKLQKLRNERVRDNKMKCVKAVTVANWSEVPEEDRAKRRRERSKERHSQWTCCCGLWRPRDILRCLLVCGSACDSRAKKNSEFRMQFDKFICNGSAAAATRLECRCM